MPTLHESSSHKFDEDTYPYATPDRDIIEDLEFATDMLNGLENVFVRWMASTNNPKVSFSNLQHPAFPINSSIVTQSQLMARPAVKDALKRLRLFLPFIKLYSANNIIEIVHKEVEQLRFSGRQERFYSGDAGMWCGGKKSLNEEELNTVDMLLKCLELVRKIQTESNPNAALPGSNGVNEISGVDRVIAEAQRLIHGQTPRFEPGVGDAVEDPSRVTVVSADRPPGVGVPE
jgi:hypothetical protein